MAPKGVAYEQALHFEISWKVDAREAREKRRSRVLARLASLAQIGELAATKGAFRDLFVLRKKLQMSQWSFLRKA